MEHISLVNNMRGAVALFAPNSVNKCFVKKYASQLRLLHSLHGVIFCKHNSYLFVRFA